MSIRPAATVIVARPAPPGTGRAEGGDPDHPVSGLEVLVLRRSAKSRFAPGFVVFPGGTVDPGDESLAKAWFGSLEEVARACALRELAEETGLVMTSRGLVEAPGRLPGDDGLPPPDVRDVPEVARWVTPEIAPIRFDARFFSLSAPNGLTPRPDVVEIEQAWWATPQAVLAAGAEGDAPLMWPTLRTLQELSTCRTVDEVLSLRVTQEVPPGFSGPPGWDRPA